VIDHAALDAPDAVVTQLHGHWARRRPVAVRLHVDPARFRTPESWPVEPWTVDPGFEPWTDRLHFLVWANNYDARQGEAVWWWAVKAQRLATAAGLPQPDRLGEGRLGDGRLGDGRLGDGRLGDGRLGDLRLAGATWAWIDGGPRQPFDRSQAENADLGEVAVIHAESVQQGSLAVVPERVTSSAELAADQRAAVDHWRGPARVLAPAGSGKTRVLTERLRLLLGDRGYERRQVLAVAYNVKARDEMVERTAGFGPQVQTLNGLAYSLLRDHRGGAPPVIDEREVRRIVERLAPKHRPRANTDALAPYLEALSAARLGLRDPEAVEQERDDVPGFAAMFGPYRRTLAERQVVDFDEQVYGAVEALLADGAFRRRNQDRYQHLLVDEFQDLTPAHVLMVRLLAAPTFDVFAVGDDDQVIYGHAGADPKFLTHVERYLPEAATHALEVNYRCPVVVVDAARHLLSYNHRRVDKAIRAGPHAEPSADALTVVRHAPPSASGDLLDVVTGWLAEPSVEPADVAVLTRVNSLLLAPHVALVEAGLPVASVLSPDVLDRTGTRAALAYLRIAVDPDRLSPDDLAEVYRRPSRGLPNWITKWFRRSMSIDEVARIAERIDDQRVADKVDRLADDLALVAAVAAGAGGTTRAVLTAVRDQVGLGQAMEQLDQSKGGEGSSQLDDLDALRQVADLHPDPGSFEPWLRAVFHRESAPGGITLSTIHRVKGREWSRVAVFGASAGLMPHRLAVDEEEERRVLHVGLTRGRHRVAVFADAEAPSPFLDELTGAAPHRAEMPAATPGARTVPPPVAATTRAAARAAAASPASPLTGAAAGLEQRLRAWRLTRSQTDGVPAYVVASNAVLATVAEARPDSLAALGRIPGIGPAKLDTYGDAILALVAESEAAS